VLSAAGTALHWAGPGHFAKAASKRAPAQRTVSGLALPLFFEPNQGQTDARVKFLARGSGYGLFLTANEAVLELQQPAHSHRLSAVSRQPSALDSRRSVEPQEETKVSVIRMRLDGASSAARIRGVEQLPGKSTYFIGNDPAKWHRGIPQFARVEYQNAYPGIDLVYYGEQRQLEYDFRVAPGADPSQIALSFEGASARLDSGDLVLSTAGGDVRFHAPHIYQPRATAPSAPRVEARLAASPNPQAGAYAETSRNAETPVQGSFRQLADNKFGFTVGPYDRSRELVIDPLLSYSTYLGNGGESLVEVAVDTSNNIYVAGSTTSANFPLPPSPAPAPIQSTLNGTQNIFIAVLNPALGLTKGPAAELIYATYLGGSGTDSLGGLALSSFLDPGTTGFDVYVAGTTTSPNFPTNGVLTAFQPSPESVGSHGFVSRINLGTDALRYSTYLSGNGTDIVTGLAVDQTEDAFVTGTTTSIEPVSNGFPANPNAYQPCPFGPLTNGQCPTQPIPTPTQFFASKIHTGGSGPQSMLYSTYFGGGYIGGSGVPDLTTGGGIAVDTSGNLYFTGGTNMMHVTGPNGENPFPIFNAWQGCLDLNYQSGSAGPCNMTTSGNPDAILVKINPNLPTSPPFYSTYLGGRGNDVGVAVAVDTSSNAYVTGKTNSGNTTDTPPDWNCVTPCVLGPYGYLGVNGNTNAFIVKVGNETQANTTFPQTYFTWLGGSGNDVGNAILVDSQQTVHLAGTTFSINPNLPVTADALQSVCGGSAISGVCTGDAFAALIATAASTTGDYVTYLGGSAYDEGTGIALDLNNTAYVAGATQSSDFPLPPPSPTQPPPYQSSLSGTQDAFATKIGNSSNISVVPATTSPSPVPVPAGAQAAFTYDLTNNGTDTATNLNFYAIVPTTGIGSNPTAKVTSGGSCAAVQGNTIPCFISTLAVNESATVEVDVTSSVPATVNPISVGCNVSVNGGPLGQFSCPGQQDPVVDFSITASPSTLTVNAGGLASFPITLTPQPTYDATITMSESTTPSIVTATTPTFTNPTVTLSGSTQGTTTLNIQTVPRPVTTGSLFRRGAFYATWLPIGGLSLVGLGLGASRKRRRWLAFAALGLVASLILLQPACSSSSSPVSTSGGTAAGQYTITVTGSPSTGGSHSTPLTLNVN